MAKLTKEEQKTIERFINKFPIILSLEKSSGGIGWAAANCVDIKPIIADFLIKYGRKMYRKGVKEMDTHSKMIMYATKAKWIK